MFVSRVVNVFLVIRQYTVKSKPLGSWREFISMIRYERPFRYALLPQKATCDLLNLLVLRFLHNL